MLNENVIKFATSQTMLASEINQNINSILATEKVVLPDENSPLVLNFVKHIEGEYNLKLAKQDTDNAIELVYITYNTIPQALGAGRVGLDEMQSSLLKAQKNTRFKMRNAKDVSATAHELISRIFPKWVDALGDYTPEQFIQDPENIETLKEFLEMDLVPFTKKIEDSAKAVATDLDLVSEEYEGLVEKAGESSKRIQTLLSKEINARKDLLKAIEKDKANQAKYQSLVKSISEEIVELKAKADALEKKAETAEKRAFTMGILGAVIGGIAGLVPVAVSIWNPVAGAVMQGAKGVQTTTAQGDGGEPSGKSETKAQEVKAVAEKKKQEESEKSIDSETEKLEAEDASIQHELESGDIENPSDIESKKTRREEIKLELEKLKTKKDAVRFEIDRLDATITCLRGDLDKLANFERDAASKFYAKQDVILASIADLNKLKRDDTAELDKLAVILEGYKEEQNSLEVSITSLNIAIKAIKQCKAIIDSMAFFFRNFADFMHETRRLAENQVDELEGFVGRKTSRIGSAVLTDIIDVTYNFFVIQKARWLAASSICRSFESDFEKGWSKLNDLSGHYVDHNELPDYLKGVSVKLNQLIANRNSIQDQEDEILEEKINEKSGRIAS